MGDGAAADGALLARLEAIVGSAGVIPPGDAMRPYLESWRDSWVGRARAVVRPRATAEVQAVVACCRDTGTPVVPQGGRTGVTGAGQPRESGTEIVLSLERMNRIRQVDAANDVLVAEAGCVLADVRAAAEAAGRLFPLNFGAVGSALVGGFISTNAGGINVLRYGTTRSLVLGLEVVLPNAEVWDGLRALRKDNAGYDLKQVFIGAEGTLGVITAAVLRLVPRPRASVTAFLAVPSPAAALDWLTRAKEAFAEQLTAFELIGRSCVDATARRIPGIRDPLAEPSPWYVLMEVAGQGTQDELSGVLSDALAAACEAGEVSDGVMAASLQQAAALWRLREAIPEAHKQEGRSFKHDISLPVSCVPAFLVAADAALADGFPGLRPFTFGHLGDGNLHFNPLAPPGPGAPDDLARVNRIVHDLVARFGGSISAEHGIGRLRREELARYRSPVELGLMRALKGTFDPQGLFNPGKIFPE